MKAQKRYRVLSPRFIIKHGRQKTEYAAGDEFAAVPSPLLRRAVRDGDLTVLDAKPSRSPERKVTQKEDQE